MKCPYLKEPIGKYQILIKEKKEKKEEEKDRMERRGGGESVLIS